MPRLRPAAVLLATSLAAIAASVLLLVTGGADADVGAVPATDPTPDAGSGAPADGPGESAPSGDRAPPSADHSAPAAPAAPRQAAEPEPAPTPAPPPIGRRSGSIADLDQQAAPAPTRLEVAALGIDVSVSDVGIDPASGAMVVPEDPDLAGWYGFGPSPGETGSAVVTAHVDSRRFGVGPFERLRVAEPGAEVTITYADGSRATFVVTGRRQYAKTDLPVDELFRRDGPPTLALVTCGGEFDPTVRRYEDNVVVYAVPA